MLVPCSGYVFVPSSGFSFVPSSGYSFVSSSGYLFVPSSDYLFVPGSGYLFVPSSSFLVVPSSGHCSWNGWYVGGSLLRGRIRKRSRVPNTLSPPPPRCRANVAHIRQSRPDPGLGFEATVLEQLQVVFFSPGSRRAVGAD